MASEKDICNLALRRLGQSVGLIDTGEDSAYAEVAKDCYPIVRDALLERHAWNFATTRVRVPEIAGEVIGLGKRYAVPSDCIRILSVLPAEGSEEDGLEARWVVENAGDVNVIQTEIEKPILKYVRRVRNTDIFSAGFTDALAWHLAATLAGPIVKGEQGQTVGVKLLQQANLAERQAITFDVNQRRTMNYERRVPYFYDKES